MAVFIDLKDFQLFVGMNLSVYDRSNGNKLIIKLEESTLKINPIIGVAIGIAGTNLIATSN